jgi:exonuclease SbcC
LKVLRSKFCGVTRYDRTVELDFSALPPGVIAITGPNGAGKTTLLECLAPGVMYRELPTRTPSNIQSWMAPGAFIENAYEIDGEKTTLRVENGTTTLKGAVMSRAGVKTDGKLKSFDEEVVRVFGESSSFYATAFASQGGAGRFAVLPVAERRELFAYYLDLGRMNDIARAAKAKREALDLAAFEGIETTEATMKASRDVLARELREANDADDERVAERVKLEARAPAAHERDRARREFDARIAKRDALAKKLDATEEDLAWAKSEIKTARHDMRGIGIAPDTDEGEVERARESLAEWKLKARDARREIEGLKSSLERAKKAERLLESVPCKGEGKFSGCALLGDAIEQARTTVEIQRMLDEQIEKLASYERIVVSSEADLKAAEDRLVASRKIDALADRIGKAYEVQTRQLEVAATLREELAIAQADVDASKAAEGGESVETLRDLLADNARAAGAVSRRIGECIERLQNCDRQLVEIAKKRALLGPTFARARSLDKIVKAFSPTGIPALEIESAGPRVADLANDLLSACYGDRFSVDVRTTRALKSGKGEADDFAIVVNDSLRGRSGDLSSLSGGEQVIVDEALRIALACFALERGRGSRIETLWRDETPAALYGENVGRYASMLVRAVSLAGFHRVFVVGSVAVEDVAVATIEVSASGDVKLTAR